MLSFQTKNKKLKHLIEMKVMNSNINNSTCNSNSACY